LPFVEPSHSEGVHVAAAASLENVLRRLLADFAVQQPAIGVRTICGGSDELANHVLSGMHVDLFLSADIRQFERLVNARVVAPQAPVPLAANRLAVVSSPSRPLVIHGPRTLLQPAVKRIALADPSCPLGHYARCYLEPLGLWESVRQRALFLDNPRGVLAAVESGRAEVGLVYRSDALAASDCRILFSVRHTPSPICYTAALTRSGEQSPGARGLLAFLTSPVAARRFRGSGFLPIGPTRER
jgi:molybdate transport system substrate-binding protein